MTPLAVLDALRLLLPALVPSWRFFDKIAPSPRIEYAIIQRSDEQNPTWSEFRPRPKNVSLWQAVFRLFWNPVWNETLYLVSCAERLSEQPSDRLEHEIASRIMADLVRERRGRSLEFLKFRLVIVERVNGVIERHDGHHSAVFAFSDQAAP